jgi:hypothetical protein
MAIPFLWPIFRVGGRDAGRLAFLFFLLGGGLATRASEGNPPGEPVPPAGLERHRERAKFEYNLAKLAIESGRKATTNYLWLGRTAFDWAEFATTKAERAVIANQGIGACEEVIRDKPDLADGYYYLAMNQGQLAQTKTIGALHLVDEIESNFKRARELGPRLDFAGPDRSLGLLYHDAPGWPVSVGSKAKARLHLKAAVALCPDYPGNRLELLEACLSWRDAKGTEEQAVALEKLWPAAREQFKGDEWSASWDDWEERWAKLKAEAAQLRNERRRGRL